MTTPISSQRPRPQQPTPATTGPAPAATTPQAPAAPASTSSTPPAAQTQAPAAPARTANAQSAREANATATHDVNAQARQAQVNAPAAGAAKGTHAPSLDDAAAGRGTLQRGQTGESVRELQTRLNASGADPQVAVDGSFGRETERAVRQFQESRGITVDGKVGPETMGQLNTPTSTSIASDPQFQRLPPQVQQDVRGRLDGAATPEARRNIASLATDPGFGQMSPQHQQQLLQAQAAAPGDAALTQDLRGLAANPQVRNLNSATTSEVIRHMGTPDAAQRANFNTLATNPGFAQLNPAHQRQVLDAQAQAPRDAQVTQDLTRLADSAQFRGLNDTVKTNALEEIARHPTDPAARQTISQLATSPGFAQLPAAEQNRMLNYAGGTNPLSTHVRPQLGTLLASPAYTGADAAGQAQQLRAFMANNNVPPGLVASLPQGAALPQRPYTITGPTNVANHPFASGPANAQQYQVNIDGRNIPVYITNPPAPGSHTVDQAAQSLASLPAASRAAVNQVNINPGTNPADPHWAQVYNRPGFRSYMTAGSTGTVDIYPSAGTPPNQQAMAESMIHETGHVLSNRAWGDNVNDPRWNQWRTATQRDGVNASNYATSSAQEDFAETLVLYQRVRGTPQEAELRAMMPERFRILDTMGL